MIQNRPETRQRFFAISDIRVIDGDTIEARIGLAFKQTMTSRIRLKEWWAPELSGPSSRMGIQAMDRLHDWIRGRELFLFAPSDRIDKYGRIVAHLWWEGRIVGGAEVLGELQLTKAKHNAMKRAEVVAVYGPRHRPYKALTDDELASIIQLSAGTGTWEVFAALREAEERGSLKGFLADPATPPGTGSVSPVPSLT